MIIRLKSDCINQNGRFRFNFFEKLRSGWNIYEYVINDENEIYGADLKYFTPQDDSGDNHENYRGYSGYGDHGSYSECDSYDDYGYYCERDDEDEVGEVYFDRSTKHSFELDKLYICFFEGNVRELYALMDGDEVIVLFRNMDAELEGQGNYEDIRDSLGCYPKLIYNLMEEQSERSRNVDLRDVLEKVEDVNICVITDKIYVISTCYCDTSAGYFLYTWIEEDIKYKYSLDELLEIEKSDGDGSKSGDKVYKRSLFPKSGM